MKKLTLFIYLFTIIGFSQTNCSISSNWNLKLNCAQYRIYIENSNPEAYSLILNPNIPSTISYSTGNNNYQNQISLNVSNGVIWFHAGQVQSWGCHDSLTIEVNLNFIYNGTSCNYTERIYIPECACYESDISVELSSSNYETTLVRNSPFGDLNVPTLCDLELDINSQECKGTCVEHYSIVINQFNPVGMDKHWQSFIYVWVDSRTNT